MAPSLLDLAADPSEHNPSVAGTYAPPIADESTKRPRSGGRFPQSPERGCVDRLTPVRPIPYYGWPVRPGSRTNSSRIELSEDNESASLMT